jgi:hypothetical protein
MALYLFTQMVVTDEFYPVIPTSLQSRDVLTRKYGVFEWLHAEYVRLAERDRDLTLEEAEKLGPEALARICQLREQIGYKPDPSRAFCSARLDFDVEQRVDSLFHREWVDAFMEGELDSIAQSCHWTANTGTMQRLWNRNNYDRRMMGRTRHFA